MALRKIATIGEPLLRRPAAAVELGALGDPPLQQFIDDLIATMRDANGAGLAAPQVYEALQICAIEVGDNPRYPYKPKIPLTILVNPRITPLSNEIFENFEGCLSVPNLRGRVLRHSEIRVQGFDRTGAALDFEVRGLTAGTYQHEVDHLNGKLFVDRLINTTSLCTWEHFERYHREQFVKEARQLVDRWGA